MHDASLPRISDPGPATVSIEHPAKAWARRILPPLLLLWPLGVRNGALLYLCGVALFPFVLWSFVTFAANLIRWQPLWMVRPGLCLAIFVAWRFYVDYTMVPAVLYANALAERIQLRCTAAGRCPRAIGGWPPGHGTLYGEWVQWRIRYFTDGSEFSVHVMMGMDVSHAASGGVGRPLVRIGER
jgi:hypothetical protein